MEQIMDEPGVESTSPLWVRIVWVVCLALSTVIVGGISGLVVADWVRVLTEQDPKWLELIVGAVVGGTFLIASLERVTHCTSQVALYLRGRPVEALYSSFFVLGGVVAFLTGCVAIALGLPNPKDQVTGQLASSKPIYLQRSPQAEGKPVPVLRLYFPLAKGPEEGWREGIELKDDQVEFLHELVTQLAPCVGDGPKERVVLRVTGYADDNEFQRNGYPDPAHNELNLEVANLRAERVYSTLQNRLIDWGQDPADSTDSGDLLVAGFVLRRLEPWTSKEFMEAGRRLIAGMETHSDPERGLLYRRVDIVLEASGACQFLEPGNLSQDPA